MQWTYMIKIPKYSGIKCRISVPWFRTPKAWYFLNPFSFIIYIDSKFTLCGHNGEINTTSGMIVSHETYPWQYPGGLNCSLILQGQEGKDQLRFTFHSIDLDNMDTLTIGEQRIYSKDRDVKIDDITLPGDDDVRINFNMMSDTKSGKGFIICFKCKYQCLHFYEQYIIYYCFCKPGSKIE